MAHTIEVVGLQNALNQLQGVERKVRKKLLRKYVNEATKRVLKDAKKLAPVAPLGTLKGLYRKSLGRKIKSYQAGLVQVGLVALDLAAQGLAVEALQGPQRRHGG